MPPAAVEPLALDCAPGVELLAPPLAEGAVPPAALLLEDGEVALLVDGDVPPAAPVLPVALPEPEDWLVCAL